MCCWPMDGLYFEQQAFRVTHHFPYLLSHHIYIPSPPLFHVCAPVEAEQEVRGELHKCSCLNFIKLFRKTFPNVQMIKIKHVIFDTVIWFTFELQSVSRYVYWQYAPCLPNGSSTPMEVRLKERRWLSADSVPIVNFNVFITHWSLLKLVFCENYIYDFPT